MVMAPMTGLAPWLQIMEVVLPTDAQLDEHELKTSSEQTILAVQDFYHGIFTGCRNQLQPFSVMT
jgi:hypothetical protein